MKSNLFLMICLAFATTILGQAPIFLPISWKNDTILQYPNDCSALPVKLKASAFGFCPKATGLKYAYEVDLDNNGTIDLKGNSAEMIASKGNGLTFGTHQITWTARDACGRSSKLSKLFTVVDAKKPTVVTKSFFFADTNCQIKIKAIDLNNFSNDNCTPANQLRFRITKEDQYKQNFTLAEVLALPEEVNYDLTVATSNKYLVYLIAIDQDNNWSAAVGTFTTSCKFTYDTLNRFIVAMNEQGKILRTYNVDLNGYKLTVNGGHFNLPKSNSKNKVTPFKVDHPLNGVNSLDIALLSDYVLGVAPLANYNRYLAGDIDGDRKISTGDLQLLSKNVLGGGTPVGLPWLFFYKSLIINKDSVIATPGTKSPVLDQIDPTNSSPTILSYLPTSPVPDTIVYLGIKVGDVDLSSDVDSIFSIDDRALTAESIKVQDIHFTTEETLVVPVDFSELNRARAFQGTIHFDAEKLELLGIEGLEPEQYSLADLVNGNLTFLRVATMHAPTQAVRLIFKALQASDLSQCLSFAKAPLASEVYWSTNQKSMLHLEFQHTEARLYGNAPNPFSERTQISFSLPQEEFVRFVFTDAAGRQLWTKEQRYAAGTHQLEVLSSDLLTSGIILVQLITKEKVLTHSMLCLKN